MPVVQIGSQHLRISFGLGKAIQNNFTYIFNLVGITSDDLSNMETLTAIEIHHRELSIKMLRLSCGSDYNDGFKLQLFLSFLCKPTDGIQKNNVMVYLVIYTTY